ncbi:MAG: hypothetical protein EOP34_04750 [Rickettsiales bacterium]|nr:MAG: hypothetical protein EOP34_04750 [Rickettsiales bacterium]
MKKSFIFILFSNAVILARDKSVFSIISLRISNSPIYLGYVALFISGCLILSAINLGYVALFISGCLILSAINFLTCSIPPKPHGFISLPLESGLHTGIRKITTYLYSRRVNLTISFGGFIMLLFPIKQCFSILGWMDYFPLVSAIYAALFTAVSLLCEKKDLPDFFAFISIMTCAFFIAFTIRQCNIHDISYLLLTYTTSSGLLLVGGDYSFSTPRKLVLFADREVSGTPGQQQDKYQSNVNQPTSHHPSLNIASENDKN